MKQLRLLAASALLMAGVGVLAAEDALRPSLDSIPADAYFLLMVDDVSASMEKWGNSRLTDMWNAPEMGGIRERAKVVLEEKDESGESMADILRQMRLDEFREHFQGFFAVFSTDLSIRDVAGSEYAHQDICLLAEISPDKHEAVREWIERLMGENLEEANLRRSMTEHRDIAIYQIDLTTPLVLEDQFDRLEVEAPVTIQYALMGGTLIITEGQNQPIRKVINTLLDEEAERLPARAAFRVATERLAGANDAVVYMDLPHVLDFFEQNGSRTGQGLTADKVASFFQILDATGFRRVGPLSLGVGLEGNRIETRGLLQMPRDRRGLVAMLYSGGVTSAETATLAPADVEYYTSFTLDFAPLLGAIRQMATDFGQAQGLMLYDMWRVNFRESFGVDVEEEILNNIAGEHAVWTRKREVDPENFWEPDTDFHLVIGLTNGSRAVLAINQLLSRLSTEPFSLPIVAGEQNGFRIWASEPEMGAVMAPGLSDPAVGLTDRFLVISPSQAATRDTVRRIATGGGGGSLAEVPAFRRALELAPSENLRSFAYTPPRAMQGVLGSFAAFVVSAQIGAGIASGTISDAQMWQMMESAEEMVPGVEFIERYFGPSISTANLDARALDIRYIMTLAEE